MKLSKMLCLLASVGLLVACSTAGVKNVEYTDFERSAEISRSFDDVWGHTLEWSAMNSFPIEDTDKSSGIIKLSGSGTVNRNFFQSPLFQRNGAELDETLVSCGEATGNIGLYGAKFTDLQISAVIILRDLGEKTRVTVNLTGNAGVEVRNAYGVVSSSRNTCPSKGIFESQLFFDLAQGS
jgi:hypothetical protein